VVFETDLQRIPYLADHKIGLSRVFPLAGYLELAVSAAAALEAKPSVVTDLNIVAPISWDEAEPCRIQVVLTRAGERYECQILRRADESWYTAATCQLTPAGAAPSRAMARAPSPNNTRVVDIDDHYRRCQQAGIGYGPTFRGLNALCFGSGEAWGEARLPESLSCDGYLLHPALLDACLQVTAGALGERGSQVWLPVQVTQYRLYATPVRETCLQVHARVVADGEQSITVDLTVCDRDGQLLAVIEGLTLKPTGRKATESALPENSTQLATIREVLSDPRADALAPLQDYIYVQLGQIMQLAVDEIPPDKPLNTLGLDSMMALELRDQLERDLRVTVPFEALLQDRSLRDFVIMLRDKLRAAQAAPTDSALAQEPVLVESWIEGAL
jgi:acyl transferase domain-containing protein